MNTRNTTLTFLLFTLFAFASNADHLHGHILFAAKMNGAQEVPAVATNGQGIGAFILNQTRDTLCITISMTGLSGPVTGIHIHEAPAGQNGSVVIDLTPFLVNNQVAGMITGSALTTDVVDKMLRGLYYVNAHTAMHPNGEIRGQIMAEMDRSFMAMLEGTQEAPPVMTNAKGLGVFILSPEGMELKMNVAFEGLSGPVTGAHLHVAPLGVAGSVVEDLTMMLTGSRISGTVNPTSYLADLLAGNVYINVHTADNPNGEIRGQLMLSDGLAFDAALTGAQEVPPVATTGFGVASLHLNTTFDSLTIHVQVTDLPEALTGIHIHDAPPGQNGSVLFDLTPWLMGTHLTGVITGADLTDEMITKLLIGNLYVNAHTPTNPNGEIRGQIYRTLREGYSVLLNGSQEVPTVTTNGYGSGIVSIDRDQSNAHFMFVYGGLSGPATGAHFHQAPMGQNGGVIFDLTPFIQNDGGIYGYWNAASTPAFNTAQSVRFRNDSVYVNIHTAQNPNGEIRGQVMRDLVCNQLSTGIRDAMVYDNTLEVYPNPSVDAMSINVRYVSDRSGKATLDVFDAVGKKIVSQPVNVIGGSNVMSIDASLLSRGVYNVKLQFGNGIHTCRFVKQ